MNLTRLIRITFFLIIIGAAALLWTQREYLTYLISTPAYATAGTAIFGGTGGTGGNIYGSSFIDHANTAYFLTPSATGTSATIAGTLNIGNGGFIQPAFGPLNLQYKSGLNTWATGLTIQDTTGNVGIGTTSPVAKLQVAGSGVGSMVVGGECAGNYTSISLNGGTPGTCGTSYNLVSSSSDTDLYINRPTSHTLHFRENNADQMVILAGGNVGIGTAGPNAKLSIDGAGTSGNKLFVQGGANNTGDTFVINERTRNDSQNSIYVQAGVSSGDFVVKTSGNVGIGTTSPSYKFHVVATSGNAIVGNASDGSSSAIYGYGNIGIYGQASTAGGWGVYGYSPTGIGVYGQADASHYGIYCNAGYCGGIASWYNSSDRRLKKNIATINNPLDKINKLRGVTFVWKDKPKLSTQLGFIAQEVLPVLPELIAKGPDGYYTMEQAPVTALLVEGMKEQQKQIDTLKEKNHTMEEEIKEIKSELEQLKK